MNDSMPKPRDLAIKALATIGSMYPNSSVAKKLDNGDDQTFERLVGVWMVALHGVPEDQIAHGLKTLMREGGTFEPTIPEFVKMCKGSGSASHKMYRPLPAPSMSNAPASIDHYEPAIQEQLTKAGMVPMRGETKHQYAMRCKNYAMAADYDGVIGGG